MFARVRGLFLESPEKFRAYFGWHNSLCIFKTKASRGMKLCSYFYYSLCNILKDQLYRISRSEFYEWLFGPEKFSGLSRNGSQSRELKLQRRRHKWRIWLVEWGKISVLYVAARTYEQVRAVHCKTTTWNYNICCFVDDLSTQPWILNCLYLI